MEQNMNSCFLENKEKLLNELLPLMPEPVSYNTLIDGLMIVRRDTHAVSEVCMQQPVFLFSVQGEKRYAAGSKVIDYNEGQIVFQGAPMPSSSYVLKASKSAFLYIFNVPSLFLFEIFYFVCQIIYVFP